MKAKANVVLPEHLEVVAALAGRQVCALVVDVEEIHYAIQGIHGRERRQLEEILARAYTETDAESVIERIAYALKKQLESEMPAQLRNAVRALEESNGQS